MKMAHTWMEKSYQKPVFYWIKPLALLILCSAFFASNLQASTLLPSPFELHSQTTVWGMKVKADQVLEENNGIYQLSQTTHAPFIRIEESSVFRFDENQQLIPIRYDYQRSVFGKKLTRKHRFAEDGLSATYQENKKDRITIALNQTVADPLNFILLIQQWLKSTPAVGATKVITSVNKKRVREQEYQVIKSEWIETDLGWFDTVVIERNHSDDSRKTIIWLAKDWDYLVVKMLHDDDDVGEQNIFMRDAKLAKKEIKGLSDKP